MYLSNIKLFRKTCTKQNILPMNEQIKTGRKKPWRYVWNHFIKNIL